MRVLRVLLFATCMISLAYGQQDQPQGSTPESSAQAASKKDRKPSATSSTATTDKAVESGKPAESSKADANEATDKEEHYDVAEVPTVITHHQIVVNGKTLNYTATAGRLPSSAATARRKRKCSSWLTHSTDRKRRGVL